MTENEIGKIVVDAAIQLHRSLGPGLLESVYEATLARRLEKAGLALCLGAFVREKSEQSWYSTSLTHLTFALKVNTHGVIPFADEPPW